MLAELTATVHPGRVERTLDDALARRLTSLQLVAAVVGDLTGRGRAGSSVLRQMILDRAGDYRPVESGNERRFLDVLERAGVAAPAKRQVNLGDDTGFIGRADFYDDELCLDIEIDSDLFHSAKLDREADARRDARLEAGGFTVLRISEQTLWMDPSRVPLLVQSARISAARSLALRLRARPGELVDN
jgi:very-short-patch-repair endonuclease